MNAQDRIDYRIRLAHALQDSHGFAPLVAIRRACDWITDQGHDYPAADAAEEIARNERRVQ